MGSTGPANAARIDSTPLSPPISRTRSQSISSDVHSSTGFAGLLSPPISISPEPMFIAASAASQIVTNDHDARSDTWFDQHGIEPSGETALVAPAALKLVNSFLDQLLFNFLSASRSTSLAALRPAVSEVLKPKLARDAINGADMELQEYMGGGDEDELMDFHNGLEPSGDWDLELVWKRTRLRCMVYSSLGDMEEEDEDMYTEQEELDGASNRFSGSSGIVSPAVAIFLTSILEFMGEQALIIAGQAAYHRLRSKHAKEERDGTATPNDIADRVVVDENDMERVALDRSLGRLWRGWKKRIRSPTTSTSMNRSFSRDSLRSKMSTSRRASVSTDVQENHEAAVQHSLSEILSYDYAASIPLPMGVNDVREIEIPGLAPQTDDEDERAASDGEQAKRRPKSLLILPGMMNNLPTPVDSQANTPTFESPKTRKRSSSLPSPSRPIFSFPSKIKEEAVVDSEPPPAEVVTVEEESAEESEPVNGHNKGAITGVVAGAAALGAAAIASIVAVAKGGLPAIASSDEESTSDLEDIMEEPEILTSSRVSIGGRATPPDPALSRKSSGRSQSVHSLRLVDVNPRSPSRSRHSSRDANDLASGGPTSQPQSGFGVSPPSPEFPHSAMAVQRGATSSPIIRMNSALSQRGQRGSSAANSISEIGEQESDVDEVALPDRSPLRASQLIAAHTRQQPAVLLSATSNPVSYKEPSFVLAPAPRSRESSRSRENSQTRSGPEPNQQLRENPGRLRPHIDSGVPPLTPLREMMEGAPDTSDEDSVHAQERDVHAEIYANGSPRNTHFTKPYMEIDKLADQHPLARNTTHSTNGVSPVDDELTPRPFLLSQRSLTSGSIASISSQKSQKHKAVRTSEDSVRGGRSSESDKGKSFEELIRSNETISYTLTPQSMKKMEPLDNGPPLPFATTSTGFPAVGPRSRAMSKSSLNKFTGLNSNPPPDLPRSSAVPRLASQGRPVSKANSKLRGAAPQARDARVGRDSMADFAAFIREEHPDGPIPAKTNSHRGANGTTRNASSTSTAKARPTAVIAPRRSASTATRRRLEAREAIVPVIDTNTSDLIDFIRQGPPTTNSNNPRIPRTVAPFRTTMDSEQMSGAVDGVIDDSSEVRYSQASTNLTDQSMQSSVNSQSALLKSYKPTKVAAPQASRTVHEDDMEDMMPKRKTRRVKDPYAIDLSDEDEDEDDYEEHIVPKKPVSKDESLLDFLNSAPPPPPAITQPFELSKPITKRASSGGLMNRIRGNSISGSSSKPLSSSSRPPTSSRPTARNGQAPKSVASSAKPSTNGSWSNPQPQSGRVVPIPTNFPPRQTSYGNKVDGERNPAVSNKVLQKGYQPRDATNMRVKSQTSDLADFLMNTPPPARNEAPPVPFTISSRQQPEQNGFSKIFGRKKKSVAS